MILIFTFYLKSNESVIYGFFGLIRFFYRIFFLSVCRFMCEVSHKSCVRKLKQTLNKFNTDIGFKLVRRSQWAIKNLSCCLLSQAAIANQLVNVAPIYTSSTNTCLVRCEIGFEWPIIDVLGQIQEIQPQCHHSPRHLTTMILSNDPRYGRTRVLQGTRFILQILIEDVSKG
jgi:hypothetical protein